MKHYQHVLRVLVPDIMQVAKRRVDLLDYIAFNQPVGRRALACYFNLSERRLRTEIEQLKALDLVTVDKKGIWLSELSQQLLTQIDVIFDMSEQLNHKALQLCQLFNISTCRVVPGDSDKYAEVYQKLAQAITEELDHVLPEGENIIAITGGSTLSQVIPNLSSSLAQGRDFKVVPARGGGIGSPTIQANTLSHDLAAIVDGDAMTLFVPEQLSQSLYESLLKDPLVNETVQLLKNANCLIYSIGNAEVLAERRGVSAKEKKIIQEEKAVGEAIGVFFDAQGRIVHRLARIGLGLEDLYHLPCEVLVVGGAKKAKALTAYMKLAPQQTILVVDEALANSILKETSL
ncbi:MULTISPECIES: sugar-binding transcriptional regulator [unclassified Granulicatella]|uniref:sugar-binding transcriptional regulator n=1 Tax=unclassified Granulicatella TaxID=2630493 RepID=UPI001074119A|nr:MULTISPECIES: sugar-binding domain-containing protein [unclassified Granulicatella]MBF0780846.1 SorC family transcriptional regulator [Granulicatella sp. 19428wC4_WM01]TFU93513.1 SorC family transcriptional regulator [Granulicatella sp. WM01]